MRVQLCFQCCNLSILNLLSRILFRLNQDIQFIGQSVKTGCNRPNLG